LAKGHGKSKAIIDETPQQQIERERKKSEAAAMEEFGKSIGSGFVGPADRQFQRVLRDGGSESAALLDHVNRRRAIFSPDDVQKMPKSIQEWENNKARETVAFAVWNGKLRIRIADKKLPLTLQDVENMDVADVMGDIKAHSIRRITNDQKERCEREFEKYPYRTFRRSVALV
jgi:hypothetical protein